MARRKETIAQVDFSFGATRPESVEREDTPLVVQGLKEALNTVGLTTGALEGRPGLMHVGSTEASAGVEVDLGAGRVFEVHVVADGVVVYDDDGAEVASFLSHNWDANADKYGSAVFVSSDFWVISDPDTSAVLIGALSYPPHALTLDAAGVWAFGALSYATTLSGVVNQPYWPYYPDVSITPSARTGTITVTASAAIFTTDFEGLRLRYGGREIVLTTFVSSTVMDATVTQELPPTLDLTVASVSGYEVGDAVEHSTLGGQGIVTGIDDPIITVLATSLWDGFEAEEKLVGPNASQVLSLKEDAAPAASFLWDLQMSSKVHGYPGWGTKHQGRAYFCQFPSAPNAFAVSVAQRIDDFGLGVNDGDAFVEVLGANLGGDLLYIISAEDLLFFTTRGLYYQPTRGGEDVTPQTIAPVLFSRLGCKRVVPVALDDGAVFADAAGQQIHAALLAGDYYKSWATQNISQYHSHLIETPIYLGATQFGSDRPESFIFVVSVDGSAAVCQWDRTQNKIGWRPWETQGRFQSIYQAHSRIRAVVDRDIDGVTARFREVFQDGIYLDSAVSVFSNGEIASGEGTKLATHLNGATGAMYLAGWDLGDGVIAGGVVTDPDGNAFDFPTYGGLVQIGFTFGIRVTPWPRRSSYSQRGERAVKRLIKTFITVQDTQGFEYEGGYFGGYRVGEDFSVPPNTRSEEVGFIASGRGPFLERPIVVDRPGKFRLLKIRQRVSV